MTGKPKLIRISTVPLSMNVFCRGLLAELAKDYEVVAVTSPGEGFQEIAQREGVRTVAVPMRRAMAPLHDLLSLCRLVRLLRAERPRMVHSITPKAGLLSMVAARMAGVPVRVHTFTGLLFPTAKGWRRHVLKLTDRLICACATHVHAEGEGVRDCLLCHGITTKPIRILGHGNVRGIDLNHYRRTPAVEADALRLRQSLGIPAAAFTFVFVGRLVADKGIGELVDAFRSLAASHPGVHLLLVGDVEKANALSPSTLQAIADNNGIHHLPWKDDVRPCYAAADALVFPSHREGFPNVVIEAGAMGLSSIVTDINGSREIISHGVNGLVIQPCDGSALLRAMAQFVETPALVTQLSREARPLVASRFEQGYVRQCLKDFYREAMG